MKTIAILLALYIGSLYQASAQRLTFTYDAAGNQIERVRTTSATAALQAAPKTKRSTHGWTDTIHLYKTARASSNRGQAGSIRLLSEKPNRPLAKATESTPSLRSIKKRSYIKNSP